MSFNNLASVVLISLIVSCNNDKQTKPDESSSMIFENKGHELVYGMVQKVGDYKSLSSQKNVRYTYTYQTPDNKTDVSTEMYIFDGELSYGNYRTHERTLPQLEGMVEQGYDGNEFWLKHNGKTIDDTALLKAVAFNRPTNFYWFTMMQKLLDPGVNYEHVGDQKIGDQEYDIVKITFTSEGDKPTDIYHLYINRKTVLVDQFLFTVVDHGVKETPLLMQMEYENIDGLLLPTQRKYKKSNWNAEVTDEPWIQVTWSDIHFDTGITKEDFKKENDMAKHINTSH